MAQNGISFGAESFGKVLLQPRFVLIEQYSEIDLSARVNQNQGPDWRSKTLNHLKYFQEIYFQYFQEINSALKAYYLNLTRVQLKAPPKPTWYHIAAMYGVFRGHLIRADDAERH